MEELSKYPEVMELICTAVKLCTTFDVTPGGKTWDIMRSLTPELMLGKSGTLPAGFQERLNGKLIRIAKA